MRRDPGLAVCALAIVLWTLAIMASAAGSRTAFGAAGAAARLTALAIFLRRVATRHRR